MSATLTQQVAQPVGLVVTVVSPMESASFCRQLATVVNGSPMHLASVLETATQVYPVRLDSHSGKAVVRECELRFRNPKAADRATIEAVLSRIAARYEVREATVIDSNGSPTVTLPVLTTAA
jgi:hypothetical protein